MLLTRATSFALLFCNICMLYLLVVLVTLSVPVQLTGKTRLQNDL